MANKVLIDIMNNENHDAGTKARNDTAEILKNMGFEQKIVFNRNHSNFRRLFEVIFNISKIGSSLKNDELIVLQYPYQVKIMKLILKRLDRLRKKTGCIIVILIHDIVYLRGEKYVTQDLNAIRKAEINFFNYADAIISHNQIMTEELVHSGLQTKIFEVGIFDYLHQGNTVEKRYNPEKIQIVFAGNLSNEKSGFIYSYTPDDGVEFNLYGNKPNELKTHFNYKGSFPPNELINNIEGNYGLVWDGPSANSCEGSYGNYLRYNNPHKFSLYVAAGLPVIVWKQSALAAYVERNDIGICINSLEEITSKVKNVEVERYHIMLSNVKKIQNNVTSGNNLRNTINQIHNARR